MIDGASNTVINTVTVGGSPLRVGVNPTTNRIYVSYDGGDSIAVINGANNTVVGTVTVGTFPVGIGVNPNTNRIYVANRGSGTVSVIDGASNTVIDTVTLGNMPWDVDINPDTNRVYVVNQPYGLGTVWVIADSGGADLSLSMNYTVDFLSEITFTVEVSNLGPGAADGAAVSNSIAASLQGATGSCVGSGGAVCTADNSANMTIATFPAGSVATYSLNGTLADWSVFENTATVSAPVGVTDPNPSNNSATLRRYQVLLFPVIKNFAAP